MTILKRRTKRGMFLFEIGSTKDKNKNEESLEDYLIKTTSGNKKVEEAFNIFLNYHLSNGYKKKNSDLIELLSSLVAKS